MPPPETESRADAPEPFDAFYRREHGEQVRRAFLLTRSNEVANDVVHDAMLGLYRRWNSIARPAVYLLPVSTSFRFG